MLRFCGFRLRAVPVFLGTLLALAGCSDIPGYDTVAGLVSSSEKATEEKTKDAAGDAPFKLRIGDRYTFDNPVERWEVVAIEGQHVSWRSDARARRITNVNPILPPLEWQNHATGSGRRLIRDEEGSLFPMRVGATTSFRVTATSDHPPFGWEHKWTCRVDERKTVDTISGPFETFVVRCGHGQKNRLTYYYAPKVGNYVVRRVKQSDGQPDLVRNLLSFERADGTVVAGIVPGKSKTASVRPTENPKPALVQIPPLQPDPEVAAIAQEPDTPTGTSEEQALASVVLTAPKFGGRDAPLPPQRPVKPRMAQTADRGAAPPPPTPAPLAKVRRAVPPPPVPKAVPPQKPVPKARTVRVAPPLVGPRAVARPGLVPPRQRVPVPPPPTVRKAVPSVPPPPPIPAAAKPVAAVSPSVPPPPAVPKPVANVPPPPPALAAISTVHLASYRSEPAAQEGWTALATANSDLLDGLKPAIRRVDVDGKGTYFRLYAKPVSASMAAELCRKLNSRGVFCSPAG